MGGLLRDRLSDPKPKNTVQKGTRLDDARPKVDADSVRRLFRTHSGSTSFIEGEILQRMAERLDYLRIDPKHVLDSHSRPAGTWQALVERYPKARLTALSLVPPPPDGSALAPKTRGRGLGRWFASKTGVSSICADIASIPLRQESVDVIWSNLALHWHDEPHRVFPEWQRVLKVDGLVMFSTFGPDTLRELGAAFSGVDDYPHVIPFTDMHDFGDMLVDSGFSMPVMDMETVTLTYVSQAKLWEDVRALGGNPLRSRRRGLLSRAQALRLSEGLDRGRGADGSLRLTFEVIYGHAWKAQPRTTSDGRAILRRIERKPGSVPP